MKLITFGEFYAEAQPKLTEEQLRYLAPTDFYAKIGDTLFGLFALPEKDLMIISIAVGQGFSAFRELRKELVYKGVKYAGFVCRDGGPSLAIARYYKAEIKDTGRKYGNGDPVLQCTIDLSSREAKNGK